MKLKNIKIDDYALREISSNSLSLGSLRELDGLVGPEFKIEINYNRTKKHSSSRVRMNEVLITTPCGLCIEWDFEFPYLTVADVLHELGIDPPEKKGLGKINLAWGKYTVIVATLILLTVMGLSSLITFAVWSVLN